MLAYCLCLDKRKEYWTKLSQEAKNIGLDFKTFVVGDGETLPKNEYNYIDEPNPDVSFWGYGNPKYKKHHYNAFMSHKQMIKNIKEAEVPYFIMMEDDAYFTERFIPVLNMISDYINGIKLHVDILYLGWWIGDESDEWNTEIERQFNENGDVSIMKAKQIGGLHGAIIFQPMYDILLALPPNNPIDCQLNQLHSLLHTYVVLPKIIHTRTMFSNCEGSIIERKYI